MKFKRTKIVATIGPATESPEMLERLIKAGMNVARLNFSHGDHAEHLARIKNVRAVAKKLGATVAVLQDLSGPKVRIGDFADGSITLVPGKHFTLSTLKCEGTAERVFINYAQLHEEVKKGDIVLLDDGRRKLEILKVNGHDIITKVLVGGMIRGRRGVNIPGAFKKMSAITAKDKKDLAFGLSHGVDYVAFSFVRSAKEVEQLRKLISKQVKKHAPPIISKMETIEAIENMDAIIAATDGIMVARGDLAVEVGAENVPFLQKEMIRKCIALGKPVITATQMLESMIQSPVPTRAEVSDITNAILEGTDAVMLSEETTMGKHPVEAVNMMAQIARKTENHDTFRDAYRGARASEDADLVDAVGRAVVNATHATKAKAIVALSESGFTARMISRGRPASPIIVFTPYEETARQLALQFACHPLVSKPFDTVTHVIAEAERAILEHKLAAKGDRIVIAAGIPFGKSGGTNMMVVQTLR